MKDCHMISRAHPALHLALLSVVGISAAGCDLDVNNPGPVADEFLNNPGAAQAIVNGMAQELGNALNWVAITAAVVTRELHGTAGTPVQGVPVEAHLGRLVPEYSDQWNRSQRARWVSDDGIRRFQEVLQDEYGSSSVAAQSNLWSGYSYRLIGENYCEATINGGPPQPDTHFLRVAEERFTATIEIAGRTGEAELATAAYAGRASVRAFLGEWDAAVADAAQVPTDFEFVMPYYDRGIVDEYNWIHYTSASAPWSVHSVWNTPYAEYFAETGDPRTPWATVPDKPFGDGSLGGIGQVPFYRQMKHAENSSPIRLSSGREMRLLEAEAALRDGDWQTALNTINELRAAVPVSTVDASSAEETWTLLKRERGIELWLEGRRLGDFRRWNRDGSPGSLHLLEVTPPNGPDLSNRDLCYPIANSERDTNPNVN